MVRRGLVFAAGLVVLSGPALAADYSHVMYSSHPISGYVALYGGWNGHSESGMFGDLSTSPYSFAYDESGGGYTFGGAGRVAVGLSPTLSAQADVWAGVWGGSGNGTDHYPSPYPYSYTYTNTYPGIAGHLSWRSMNGQLIGVFASFGTENDYGSFGTIGIEAAHDYQNWRLYGQAGFTGALGGDASAESARDWYVHGLVSYFITPNLAVSGNLGYDGWTDTSDGGTKTSTTMWGARLEYKPDSMPISWFLAYWGQSYSGSDHSPVNPSDYSAYSWNGTENTVVAGIRVLYDSNGKTTLRQMADSVGLVDMNHVYGDVFP